METAIDFHDFGVKLLKDKNDLETSFNSLISSLEKDLSIKPLRSKITIKISTTKFPINDIFSLGVQREIRNNRLNLKISSHYKEFILFILLREAYYCFLPIEALDIKKIKNYVNSVIEIKLEDHPTIERWKPFIRKQIVDKEYIDKYGRIDKFFKSNQDVSETPIEFFFKYLRENINAINEDDDLYDILFKEYWFKISRNLYNDEIIETIRIITKIFYRVKVFTSLSEYYNLFIKFKRNGFINTELSLRKFRKNLSWLKKYSYVAPNYSVFYKVLNMRSYVLLIQFHPYFSKSKRKIKRILDHFPFLHYTRIEHNSFALSVVGYVILPKKYKQDLISCLKQIKAERYVLNIRLININQSENNLNLNYFREFHDRELIMNLEHPNYDKKYEITKKENRVHSGDIISPSPIEFLILDRVRYYSITGFGFERERKILNQLKADFLDEILSQASLIKELRKDLQILQRKPNSKKKLLNLLNLLSNSSVFHIKESVDSIIDFGDFLEEIIEKNNIKNIQELKKFKQKTKIDLYTNLLNNKKTEHLFNEKLLPKLFKNRKKFKEIIKSHTFFSNLLKNFFELKIFNLNIIKKIIENEDLISTLFLGKQEKMKNMHNKYKIQDITLKKIRNIINKFLETNPPIIYPYLTSTISTAVFAKYNLFIILKDKPKIREKINQIKYLFPRSIYIKGEDLITDKSLIYLDIFLPNLSLSEKETLFSILTNTFKKDIIQVLRLNSHGIMKAFSLKDYYDFDNNCYFYTEDLFSQFTLYIKNVLKSYAHIIFKSKNHQNKPVFGLNKKGLNLDEMAKITLKHKSRINLDFNRQKIQDLADFNNNFHKYLYDLEKIQKIKRSEFFNIYIQSIKFIPKFQQFGFSNYLFWCKTTDINSIKLRSLFTNSFLDIKIPAEIDPNCSSFLISYLFPFRAPNTSYINWLHKTKHLFIEYFLISITKTFQIVQFNRNLTSKGWDLKAENFISFAKNVIFEKIRDINHSYIKRYSLETVSDVKYGPETKEFKSLQDIFSYKPVDLKSFLFRKKYSKIDSFELLYSKSLIFPYIELKNLGFKEIVYIFIPNTNPKKLDSLINIFSFFNYCFLYEVEGDYYLDGMFDIKNCRQGIFIKLFLPDCAIHEFYNAFYEIFTLLGINNYAIFHDLIDGKALLKKAYGDLDFLNQYNPLTNLQWSETDKKWINIKLLDEKFN
ncbi:MAG: hypothetical protein EU549_02905, partial [Promethearchaeota archaeon]